MNLEKYILIVLFMVCSGLSSAQELSNLRKRSIHITSDSIQIDSLSIIQHSFEISQDGKKLSTTKYDLLFAEGILVWKDFVDNQKIEVQYRVFPVNFSAEYSNKDSTLIRSSGGQFTPYVISPDNQNSYLSPNGVLNKSGAITRGIAFGNNQDLSVNSSLDLQISGKLNDRISVLGSVTDSNIPIQPDGNTQQLQDFDQVYIQLYDDKSKLTAGDFLLKKPRGYFLNYNKKAQGATFSTRSEKTDANGKLHREFKLESSVAVSRGKFARNTIIGVEGNQGPYRLTGAENESFIIILAGTERVYIDGQLLKRGHNQDYTINYNSSEVVFTPKQPITKDKRITVEFQYSDKNYARSLIQTSIENTRNNFNWYFNVLAEQDSKNQPLQQTLDDDDRLIMANAGDNLLAAINSQIDSVAYSNDRVLYALKDSLGYDTVFVYSNDPELAHYRLNFSSVGQGNGDYVESDFVANGRVYEWIAPDTLDGNIIHQGSHAPIALLITPKKKQLVSAGFKWELPKEIILEVEGALSNMDLNTFSSKDSKDNLGFAVKSNLKKDWRLGNKLGNTDPWIIGSQIHYEQTDVNFEFIERYRPVEFNRNWNLNASDLDSEFDILGADISLKNTKNGKIQFGAETINTGTDYHGQKAKLGSRMKFKGFQVDFDGFVLNANSDKNSSFVKHKSDISKSFKNIRVGYRDEREENILEISDSLLKSSYQFYFWEGYIASTDSLKNGFRVFYNQRLDKAADSTRLSNSAFAEQYGFTLDLRRNLNNRLKITLSNRSLRILNEELINSEPENTLLTRLDYSLRTKNGLLNLNTFYEIGSGLEQMRKYIYLQVPAGQGVYIWNDYNGDGIKDLNEFEIAQFAYEADYIRTFTPSNDYAKTYSNSFSQTLRIDPKRIWAKKKGALKLLSRISDFASYKVDRKTTFENSEDRFNPFLFEVNDTTLLTISSNIRNTLFFNQSNPVFGVDHTFQKSTNKALLANGFESRSSLFQELRIRWTFSKGLTLLLANKLGNNENGSDFLSNRNFSIDYYSIKPSITWQPSPHVRLSLLAKYSEKQNDISFGPERAIINDIGIEAKTSSQEKGMLQGRFNFVRISYNGELNNSLAFEMLESLQPGVNFTWECSFQKNISKNLQINISYNGRKSEDNKAVHTGGMSARAFF